MLLAFFLYIIYMVDMAVAVREDGSRLFFIPSKHVKRGLKDAERMKDLMIFGVKWHKNLYSAHTM